MKSDDSVAAVIEVLNRIGLRYMVTGSLASNVYGFERASADADLVVQPDSDSIELLGRSLPASLKLDAQATFETITGTTRFIIRAGKKFKIEVFILSDDAHDQERFQRRRKGVVAGQPVWLPSPEDVIVTKLRWSKEGKRTKDVDDVRNVIAVQGDAIDWEYVTGWCEEHGTRGLLDNIRNELRAR